jgi:hypothetical protein
MTVSSTLSKITYVADGSTIDWNFPFSVTSASDIQLLLTSLDGEATFVDPSNFTVTLNSAVAPNPTIEGGFVEYPIGGPPLAAGSDFITILRILPDVQGTSLANQSTLYQTVIEAALDYVTMLTQQLTLGVQRRISVALSDPTPAALPPVAQRANMAAFFDASGNLTAGAPAGGIPVDVSAAMVPVVTAADLPTARAAMGLGDVAVENIGPGLIDDGAGNLTVNFPIVNITTNQVPDTTFYNNVHVVSAVVNYTLVRANLFFNGFGFFIDVIGTGVPGVGKATLLPRPSDTIQGLAAGAAWPLVAGTYVYLQTDGVNTWYLRYFRSPLQSVTTIPTGNTNNLSNISGTYLVKPGCTRVVGYMAGGGGGGGGNGTTGGPGSAGGVSAFGAWTCNGGTGGNAGSGITAGTGGAGGIGGTDGGGTATRIIRAAGGSGQNGQQASSAAISLNAQSGYGGSSFFGGGTSSVSGAATVTTPPIPGIGGSGAGNGGAGVNVGTGGGGGAGEYTEFAMNVYNVASVLYQVGAGGTAGPGAANGFRGVLILAEYYDHGPSQGP